MIMVQNLSFGYRQQEPIFKGFNAAFGRGETWSIIGPSGCGKTSFLCLLAGLRFPDSGKIRIDDVPLARPRPSTGLVLQDHGLLPWATVRRNTELGLAIRHFYGADGRHAPVGDIPDPEEGARRVNHWLERLGLADQSASYPAALSGGQRQRTAIARTMVLKPDLLLLDEPFSALDAPTREDLQALLTDLQHESGHTRILVTHDIEVAVSMGEKIMILQRGCNRHPEIIENEYTGTGETRYGDGFRTICSELHRKLGNRL